MLENNKNKLLILLFFIILSIIITYPLILNFTSSVPYSKDMAGANNDLNFKTGGADIWHHLWNLWWIKYSLVNLKQNPYYTKYFFYPEGVSLILHGFNFAGGLIAIPFQYIFGLIGSYNLLFLLSFILSGYFMYLLAYKFSKNIPASIISGIIYMLCPYHFEHIHHLEHLSIQWLPIYLYFFIDFLENSNLKNIFYSSLLFLIIFYTDLYAAVQITILSFLFFIFYPGFTKQRLKNATLLGLLTCIFVVPLAIPIMRESLNYDYMKSPFKILVWNSADIKALFIPSYFHGLWGSHVKNIYSNFTGFEKIVYLGFTTIVLCILSFFDKNSLKIKKLLLYFSIFFLMLSLGPFLHINGKLFPIPLPYLIINKIPFLSAGRAPLRYILIVYLLLSVLSAYGIKYILNKSNKKWICIIIAAAVLLDFMPRMPLPLFKIDADPFYSKLAAQKNNFAICELPITEWPEPLVYYQTIHHKPILAGMPTFINPKAYRYITNTPVIKELRNTKLISQNKDFSYYKLGLGSMKKNKIKYILYHKKYFQKKSRSKIESFIEKTIKLKCIYISPEMRVYKIY